MALPNDIELTSQQAAFVLGEKKTTVDKVFDEGPFRAKRVDRRRVLGLGELLYIKTYSELKREGLPKWSRAFQAKMYELCGKAARTDIDKPIRVSSVMLLDKREIFKSFERGLKTLQQAERAAVTNDDIMGGEPVMRGTRIPVYQVAAMLERGATIDELLEDYPSLDAKKIELARVYARANPRRGRPKKRPWH